MTSTRLAEMVLPDSGTIRCRLGLRMCLPRGTYTLEPFAFRPGEDQVLCTGPISTCHIEVSHPPLGRGMVDLEPRLSLTLLPSTASGTPVAS